MKNDGMEKILYRIYGLALVVTIFTGFGNMPLWKRYYIADIPGMAWAGHFFRNVQVHYITGAMLLALAAYFIVAYFMMMRGRGIILGKTGVIRAVLLGFALLTGLVMAVKNLPGIDFPMGLLIAMNFSHMGSAMLLLFFTLGCVIAKSPWTTKQ